MADEKLPELGEAWVRGEVPDGTAKQQLVWILYGPEPWNACRIVSVPEKPGTLGPEVVFAAINEATRRHSVQRWPLDKFLGEWRRLDTAHDFELPPDG